jgi:hypothetical protein
VVAEHTTIGNPQVRLGDPIRRDRRQGRMATPELISLIVALIVWIVLLGTMSTDA